VLVVVARINSVGACSGAFVGSVVATWVAGGAGGVQAARTSPKIITRLNKAINNFDLWGSFFLNIF
jgi:hypothetical protein